MVLEFSTLLVAFVVVALTMSALFYLVTYRSTRSAYCGWWCVALMLFLAGSCAYILSGTDEQWWANPLGNSLLVAGAATTWVAARSLVSRPARVWQIFVPPLLAGGAAALDDPGSNVWAGGGAFLLLMSLMFALTSYELRPQSGTSPTQTVMSVSASIVSAFYLCRLAGFTVTGPYDDLFLTYLGSEITILINLMLLVVVSFSMSLLSQQQSIMDLRTRATRDGLTGLLNRTEFLALATQELKRIRPSGVDATLILADLDHFKDINDTFGHTAGDHALRTFAAVCRNTVRSTDLVGRYGGEEFIFLLTGTSLGRAEQITAAISRQLHEMEVSVGNRLPTVSYGIVSSARDDDISAMIVSADAALYQAKLRGRDQAVLQDQDEDEDLDDVGMPDSAL